MKIHESQWHARLYRWSRDTWNTFRDDNDWGTRDNLCLYIRSIVVYAPIAILAQVALFLWAGYVFVYYPVTRIGWVGFGYEVLVVASVIGLFILYMLASAAWRRFSHGRLQRRLAESRVAEEMVEEETSAPPRPKKPKGPSFIEVVFDYLVAMKQKTCPQIEIVSDNKE